MLFNAMNEVLRLTRAGRLNDAVRLIQEGLTGADRAPSGPTTERVIDLTPIPRIVVQDLSAPPKIVTVAASQFAVHHHRGATGAIDYRLYLPANVRPGLPLVVMLHGCTQSPGDFARGTGMNQLAEETGVIVAYPRQPNAANGQKCWNWYRPADQLRDSGELALIAGIVHDVIRDHRVDPSRIYVAGLSAGGAAAANIAACYPDLFAAIAIHSGLAHGAAHNLMGALFAMRSGGPSDAAVMGPFVPTITFHGAQDTTVNPVNSNRIVAAAASCYTGLLTTFVEEGRSAGGRAYTRTTSREAGGKAMIEQWIIAGMGHAWSGGNLSGTYTDPAGPDASSEMLRFFLQHRLGK